MHYLTFQHEMTHKFRNKCTNTQQQWNFIMCTSRFEDSLFYCASWSSILTLVPLLHSPPKWEDS